LRDEEDIVAVFGVVGDGGVYWWSGLGGWRCATTNIAGRYVVRDEQFPLQGPSNDACTKYGRHDSGTCNDGSEASQDLFESLVVGIFVQMVMNVMNTFLWGGMYIRKSRRFARRHS
jgi:hypothetical protein